MLHVAVWAYLYWCVASRKLIGRLHVLPGIAAHHLVAVCHCLQPLSCLGTSVYPSTYSLCNALKFLHFFSFVFGSSDVICNVKERMPGVDLMSAPELSERLAILAHWGRNLGRRCGEGTWGGIAFNVAYRLEQCRCKCDHGKGRSSCQRTWQSVTEVLWGWEFDTVFAVKLTVA